MSDFKTVSAALTKPDPFKRVKYSMGLVLGVDEFEQEQTYFLERDRLQNRMLHGYGTVCGLRLTAAGTKITVEPGLAVDPLGREVRVTPDQCADLKSWLDVQQNRDAVIKQHGARPDNLDLYVVLCYQECETDKVPVPGAPCRSQEESIAPSRVTESFRLQFALTPPDQAEEAAIRQFGDMLSRIRIVEDGDAGALTWAALIAMVKGETEPAETILISRTDADPFIRSILRIWVTEIRPCAAPAEGCLLLGKLSFPLSAAWAPGTVTVDESDRPYLLTTRLLQEYLLRREDVTEHQYLIGLENDDHKQYLLVNPANRALIADLDAAGQKVKGLAAATANGEAVRFEQAVKRGDAAAGDLSGTYPNPSVRRLQGQNVAAGTPSTDGLVLTWNAGGGQWEPRAVPTGGGGVDIRQVAEELPTLPFVTITRLPDDPERRLPRYELWFHLNASTDLNEANMPELVELSPPEVFGERDTLDPAPHFLQPIEVADFEHLDRNVYAVTLDPNALKFPFLRFLFVLERMHFTIKGESLRPLTEWVARRPVKWVGHDGRSTVTAFHRNQPEQRQPASGYVSVAAGLVSNTGEVTAAFGELRAERVGEGVYRLTFPGYTPRGRYIVKGTPILSRLEGVFPFSVVSQDRAGIAVRVAANENSLPSGFMVEISEIR